MQPDLIIFDCDGVLIDSESLSAQALAAALAPYGVVLSAADLIRRYVGRSTPDSTAMIEADYGTVLPPEFLDAKRALTHQRFEDSLQAIDGITRLLDAVNVPVCVASGTSPDGLRHSLGLTGLWDRFAPHIFSATQVTRGKPAPDLFLFAAAQMNVSPAACLVIEDSLPGVQAGKAAGMTVYGFTGGSHCDAGHAERLRLAGADRVFSSMAEIQNTLIPAPQGRAHG